MATTAVFSIPAQEYVKATARRRLGAAAWLPALLLAAAVPAGFADSRWWYVGLMAALIIYPMALSMAWFALVGHQSMELLLRPQRWTLSDGTLTVEFMHYLTAKGDSAPSEPTVKASLSFPAAILDDAEHGRRLTLVPAPENSHRIKFLLIPAADAAALISAQYAS